MKKLFTISAILISSFAMQQANAQMRNNKNTVTNNANKTVVVNQQSTYKEENHNDRQNVNQERNRYIQPTMRDNRDNGNYTYNNHADHYNRERKNFNYRENNRENNRERNHDYYNRYEGRKW